MEETKNRKMRKSVRRKKQPGEGAGFKFNKKAVFLFLIVFLAAAAVVAAVLTALKKQESIGVADGAYYYAVDEKTELPSGTSLKREEEITLVKQGKQEYSLTGSMIFEDGGSTMLFQDDMLWYDRASDSMRRINYFSRMSRKDGAFAIERGHSSKEVTDGFLYDNGDLYVILESAALTYGSVSVDIEPMTVISCTWNGDVQLVTPDGTCAYIEQPGQDLAVVFSDNCVLNPLVDTYYQANGTWRLLFTSASMVPEL